MKINRFSLNDENLIDSIKNCMRKFFDKLDNSFKKLLENLDLPVETVEEISNLTKKKYEELVNDVEFIEFVVDDKKIFEEIISIIRNIWKDKGNDKVNTYIMNLHNQYYYFVLNNNKAISFFTENKDLKNIQDVGKLEKLLNKYLNYEFFIVQYPKIFIDILVYLYYYDKNFQNNVEKYYEEIFKFIFIYFNKNYENVKYKIFDSENIQNIIRKIKEVLNLDYNNFRNVLVMFYSIILYNKGFSIARIYIIWKTLSYFASFKEDCKISLIDELFKQDKLDIDELYNRITNLISSSSLIYIINNLISLDKKDEADNLIFGILVSGYNIVEQIKEIERSYSKIINHFPDLDIEDLDERKITILNKFLIYYNVLPKRLKKEIYEKGLIESFLAFPSLSKLPTELIEKIIADEEFQSFIEKYGASQEIVKEEFKRLIIKYNELLEFDIINKLNIDLSLEWLLENFKNINDYIYIWKQFFQVQELLNYIQIFNLGQHYEGLEKKIKIVLENIDLKGDLKIISNKIKSIQNEIKKSGVENAINKRKKYREKRKWNNVLFNKIWSYVFDLSKNDKRLQEELFDLIFALSEDKAILLSDFLQKVGLETLNKHLKEKYSANKLNFFEKLLNIDNEYLLTLLNFENIDSVLLKISNFSFENKFREYFNIIKGILKSNLGESVNDDDINVFENVLKSKFTQMDITDYEKIDILIDIKDIFRKISKFNEDIFLNFYIWFQGYLENDITEDFIVFIEKIEQLINIHLLTENKDIILDRLEDVSLDTLLKVIVDYSILQNKKVLIKFIKQGYKIELYNQEPVVQQIEKTKAIIKIEESIKTQAIGIIGKSPTKWTYNDFVEFLNYLSKKGHEVNCLKYRGKGDHEIWKVNNISFAIPYRGNREYPPKTAYAIFKYILKGVLKKNL